jgi:uncharacterized membrane protein YeaQ/YmgE (transglycosylase-associated protein family)
MLIASWLLLALAVGFVTRSIVPARDHATRWIDLLILGIMGCATGALLRQVVLHGKGLPPLDFLSFALGALAAVVVSVISRALLRRRAGGGSGGRDHRRPA